MFYARHLKGAPRTYYKQNVELNVEKHKFHAHNVLQRQRGFASFGRFKQVDFEPQAVKVLCKYPFSGYLYVLATDGVYYLSPRPVKMIDRAFDGGDCTLFDEKAIFSSNNAGTYALSFDSSEKTDVMGCRHVVNCCGRLIGQGDGWIRVCEADSYDDVVHAYKFDIDTALAGAAVSGNKFYALGDVCFLLEPDGDMIESKLRPIAQNVGSVQGESVVPLGERVVFASRNGLKAVISDKVTNLFEDIVDLDFDGATACAFRGHYLVSCKRAGYYSEHNCVTLLLDVERQKVVGAFEFGFDSLYSESDDVYGVYDGKIYQFIEDMALSTVVIDKLDFGTSNKKFLRRAVVRSRNDLDLWVCSNNVKRLYAFPGSDKAQSRLINGYGEDFSLEIQSQDGFDLDMIRLEAYAYGED